jgi:hypothetical protein
MCHIRPFGYSHIECLLNDEFESFLCNRRLKRGELDEQSRLPETFIYADDTDLLSIRRHYLDDVMEVVVTRFKDGMQKKQEKPKLVILIQCHGTNMEAQDYKRGLVKYVW